MLDEEEATRTNEKREATSKVMRILFTPVNSIVKAVRAYRKRQAKARKELEDRCVKTAEVVREDIERYLMEKEEIVAWLAYELNHRNVDRLSRLNMVNKVKEVEMQRKDQYAEDIAKEDGLTFFRGQITSSTRWQNSPAKHLDFIGHSNAILSCKLSPCINYVLSCSADKTLRLWEVKTGNLLIIYSGHTNKVTDCDIHPQFKVEDKFPSILSCSADRSLRLWNTLSGASISIVAGHSEAVSRCAFSPEGKRFVSASEDLTIRTWIFPDCFLLFVYRAHTSLVTSVRFSPSGRFLLSGSDYGERKIFLWDAHMPNFEQPTQFSHIFFWTPDGLIKKILIRLIAPDKRFWLNESQLELLGEEELLEVWPGELDPEIEMTSDSEESDGEEPIDTFGQDDVRDFEGAFLSVISTDRKTKTQYAATEYSPGGNLAVSLQAAGDPIEEAFVTVVAKNTEFDIYPVTSGRKVGKFLVSFPAPWELEDPESAILDPDGVIEPHRRHVLEGLVESSDKQSIIFRRRSLLPDEDDSAEEGEEYFKPVEISAVWFCGPPDAGPVVVVANIRRRKSSRWVKLTYSLKESPIRTNAAKSKADVITGAETGTRYKFDQDERHALFWSYVREKKWTAVEGFLDRKAVLYREKDLYRRRWRVMDFMEKLFDPVKTLILSAPVTYKIGVTKSTVMTEMADIHKAWQELIRLKASDVAIGASIAENVNNIAVDILADHQNGPIINNIGKNVNNKDGNGNNYTNDHDKNDSVSEEKGEALLSRPRARALNLPQSVRTRDLDTPSFYKEVIRATSVESSSSLFYKLTDVPLPTRDEVRQYMCHSAWADVLKLPNISFVSREGSIETKEGPESGSHGQDSERSLLHQDFFGPADYDDLKLPLPVYFNSSAGHAENALSFRLQHLRETHARMKNFETPTADTDIKDQPLSRRISDWLRFRSEMRRQTSSPMRGIEYGCRLHLSAESTYLYRRRGAISAAASPLSSHDITRYHHTCKALDLPFNQGAHNIRFTGKVESFATKLTPLVGRRHQYKTTTPIGTLGSATSLSVLEMHVRSRLQERDPPTKLPEGVSLERRGAFAVLPGLDAFVLSLLPQVKAVSSASVQKDIVSSPPPSWVKLPELPLGLLRIFNAQDGHEIAHSGAINDVIFAPSESRIASASSDKLIKIWDPADGQLLNTLQGHSGDVTAVRYSMDELFLVSSGADACIIVWDLVGSTVLRRLRGHRDIVTSLSTTGDCSCFVSSSYDHTLKTWYMNPRHPDRPESPRIIRKTDTTIMILWTVPPCFNCEPTAFFIQYRLAPKSGKKVRASALMWSPDDGLSIPPHYRFKVITGLLASSSYQFRIRCQNVMGLSDWSEPSNIVLSNSGIPIRAERPLIYSRTATSIILFWLTPDLEATGTEGDMFEIKIVQGSASQSTGIEKGLVLKLTLDDVSDAGTLLRDKMIKQIASEKGLNGAQLKKMKRYNCETARGGIDVPDDLFAQTLLRAETEKQILLSWEVKNLLPGTPHRFMIRACNDSGEGPWSESSYSQSTKAACPARPEPPYIRTASEYSLLFKWDPPFDGGQAILGYDINIKHLDRVEALPRNHTEYHLRHLLPGRVYLVRVRAKNSIGCSDYSEWSSRDTSRTDTSVPDPPEPPLVLESSWYSVTLSTKLPFDHGSSIHNLEVQYRTVDDFSSSDWCQPPLIFSLPHEVEYLVPSQPAEDFVYYNPMKKSPHQINRNKSDSSSAINDRSVSISGGLSSSTSLKHGFVGSIAAINSGGRNRAEKEEPFVRVSIPQLIQNTVYEFRVRYMNSHGYSEHSNNSRKVKTLLADFPAQSEPPKTLFVASTYALLALTIPFPGSKPIMKFIVEAWDRDVDTIFSESFPRQFCDDDNSLKMNDELSVLNKEQRVKFVNSLKAGRYYSFRSQAVNELGSGLFSDWNDEVQLPKEI